MTEDFQINWSEYIIEKGKLDPLGLWRVGDRMAGELLSPFTTIVTHRPARYFSMYSWIIDYINKRKIENKLEYWSYFFKFEAVFLMAIQLHDNHNYEDFKGQIGSESAKKLLDSNKNGIIDLTKIQKMNNGWENNYKNPMFDLNLIEVDYGQVSEIKVTENGKQIADLFYKSISKSRFDYLKLYNSKISLRDLRNISNYSCPCLVNSPQFKIFKDEQKVLIEYILTLTQKMKKPSKYLIQYI